MAPSALTPLQIIKFYGISEDSLRAYEAEGLVRPLRIEDEVYYTPTDRVRIEIILKGKRLGFSLREIRTLLSAHMPAPSASLLSKDMLKRQIAELENEKAALHETIRRLRAQADKDP